MKYLFSIFTLLFLSFPLLAGEKDIERVSVHLDKECYVAGENIWIKFLVINTHFQPSYLSKVGYIEICDTQKPQMQLKLGLINGKGTGKIKIPADIPSGIYQLSGYTRYMRNEGEKVFFNRQIAIINPGQQSEKDRIKSGEPTEIKTESVQHGNSGILIKTDRAQYTTREAVALNIDFLPENTIDLTVSVSRNDTLATYSPEISFPGMTDFQPNTDSNLPLQWLPEYEGHIVTGRVIPETDNQSLVSTLSFVGKSDCLINGQPDPEKGTISFYSKKRYGTREIVTSVVSPFYEKVPYRLDVVSPFCESLPETLPSLTVFSNDKQLMDRFVGVQLSEVIEPDSAGVPVSMESCLNMPVATTYDLDQYTRFSTLSETILEFVNSVRVNKVNNKRRIQVLTSGEQRYNTGNTLVLLDGIPVFDHEDILSYNPQLIKRINIYDGKYVFGGLSFESIVSFITRQQNLPLFKLDESSQLFKYEYPVFPEKFKTPDYSETKNKKSRRPDFRHTLYWNAFMDAIPDKTARLSFYTSDLNGTFKITVNGITSDGKEFSGISYFDVIEHSE